MPAETEHKPIIFDIKAVKSTRENGLIIERQTAKQDKQKLVETLDIIQHHLRKQRIIIYNVPEDTKVENVGKVICTENLEVIAKEENTETKFRYKNKRSRYNIILEVDPQTRKQILQTKLKTGWDICNAADYLVATRCYKCSRDNHKHYACKGEETCPHCASKHKLKECTTATTERKSINCIVYNSHSKERKDNENHSSLSKDCPSPHAVLKTYRDNIEY